MKGKILNLFTKNILYLVSLLMAFSLWFYVLNSRPYEITKEMRVNYILPKDMAISGEAPEKILYTIRGPRAFIRKLENKSLSVDLNLAKMKRKNNSKKYNVDYLNADMPLPLGVRAIGAVPDKAVLNLIKGRRKDLPIKVKLLGVLDENHKMMTRSVEPKTISVFGAPKILSTITFVETNAVDINELKGQEKTTLGLRGLDHRLIYKRDLKVDFNYIIRPLKANLHINNVPIRFLTSQKLVKASTRVVGLFVLSDKGDDIRITKKDVQVIADIPEGEKGRQKIKLRVNLPEGIHLLKMNPDEIFVTVK